MKTKIKESGLNYIVLIMVGIAIAAGDVRAQNLPMPRSRLQQQAQTAPAEAEKEPGPITAIVGGRIYTVTQEIIREGTILVQDGKILKIGQDLAIPEGAEAIEATGRHIVPGFIALNASRIGMSGTTGGQNQVKDALNPFDRNIQYLLGAGITTICTSTGAGGGGRGRGGPQPTPAGAGGGGFSSTDQIVLKMTYGDIEGMFLKENPFFAVSSGNFRGGLNCFNWREELKRARSFIQAQENQGGGGEGGRRGQRPSANEEIVRLLQGESVLRTEAQTVDQIRDMITFSQNYGYRIILEGVDEGWLIADELGPGGVAAIITPRNRISPQTGREEETGGTMELAKHLEKAGVPFAINAASGSVSIGDSTEGGRDLLGLAWQAMFAVSGGCSERCALEALTIVPARMMGLQDRLGSLEAGKDADILIMDGHPLDYKTYVEKALVNGKVYYDRAVAQVLPLFDRSLFEQRIKIDKR